LGPPRGLVMTELISLLQRIRQTLIHVRQARHSAWMATTPAPRTRPQGQRASHRVNRARLARAMPGANPLTLEITANILASHGLLDETLSFKPPMEGTRRFVWLTRLCLKSRFCDRFIIGFMILSHQL
jgi:hypothetical protein